MAKRVAVGQLTSDNVLDEDTEEITHTPSIASFSVMSGRKIAMPKRKMMSFTTPKGDSIAANAFSSFKNKQTLSSTTNENAKFKALNLQFKDKIVQCVANDPIADLSPIFVKYETFRKSIKGTPTDVSPAVQTSTISPPKRTVATNSSEAIDEDSSSSEEEEKEIKVEGPSFTIASKPITGDSVFSFGPKKQEPKNDSDSESEVEIKGPQFTFTGEVKSNVFKLPETSKLTDKTVNNQTEKKTSPFTFSTTGPSSTVATTESTPNPDLADTKEAGFSLDSKVEAPSGGSIESKPFTFGASIAASAESKPNLFASNGPIIDFKKEESKLNPFSLGNSTSAIDTSTSKSAFSFDSTTKNVNEDVTTENKTPSFSFSKNMNKSDKASPEDVKTPSFTFGKAPTSSTEKIIPSFSFGKTELPSTDNKVEVKKPSFTFGKTEKPTDSESPEVKDEKDTTSKPSFTFGTSTSSDSRPAFSFGSNQQTNAQAPSFSFGKTTDTPKEESKDETGSKSLFTFGKTTDIPKEENKDETTTKPSFTFGTASTTAPSFTFGNPKTETSIMEETKPVPSAGFKFSLPYEQKTSDDATQDKAEPTTDVADENATVEEASKPLDLQNGEEDETALFTQRSKLMIFNPETKQYDSRGVGEMKVLQRKDDKSKIRLLCRSDGMGHILLNTTVVKSFSYAPLAEDNDNLVKTPTVDSEGKLTTYIVKFKLKSDGRSFIKSIEDAKKDM
ncbi:nucleoporin NUP2 NDAI_0J01610 [Naumovozyma dairenensis CBS 421]|uniref:RanBD1 domain-containing protein n=1 Tax=Naumovozyma dairenensis (strain ATCC 10597 / BCRC 20456 / CBS 421 / NBRC 0211 / NRRL Y-12639) TaxID=1071378 RepID=G0WGX5_NAUDC|nr:hypothetical protein NDAI_0J01610 [Naumovozyma dairenensis CBS 421]CCD27053.1 hypothetical protein NDAI_0J01610 [Naumovozyma dairenensis CBS 421]